MNPKLLLCLALVLGGIFLLQPAQAYWAVVQLNRTNISTTAPFVRVVPTNFGLTNNPMVEFSVFVLLKGQDGSELLSGSLTVKDSPETKPYIAETQVQAKELLQGAVPTAVPKSWAGKCKVFRFCVAARLLTNSEFSIGYTADPKWGTAGTYYVCNLEEFATAGVTMNVDLALILRTINTGSYPARTNAEFELAQKLRNKPPDEVMDFLQSFAEFRSKGMGGLGTKADFDLYCQTVEIFIEDH